MSGERERVILEAGVCGLYVALTSLRAGSAVTLLEKSEQPGGLAAGFKRGNNYFDQEVQMLHATDAESYEDLAGLMVEEKGSVTLDARIRWNNRADRYPLKSHDILAGMNPFELLRCTVVLALAELANWLNHPQKAAETAEEALVATDGAPLYEFFFEEFSLSGVGGVSPEVVL